MSAVAVELFVVVAELLADFVAPNRRAYTKISFFLFGNIRDWSVSEGESFGNIYLFFFFFRLKERGLGNGWI